MCYLQPSSCWSVTVMSTSLQPHGLQHAKLPCPLPSPGVCSDSRLAPVELTSRSYWQCLGVISILYWYAHRKKIFVACLFFMFSVFCMLHIKKKRLILKDILPYSTLPEILRTSELNSFYFPELNTDWVLGWGYQVTFLPK